MVSREISICRAFTGTLPEYHRRGQHIMNVTHAAWPELYEEVTGTDADCFYNDSRIPAFQKIFHSKIAKMWEEAFKNMDQEFESLTYGL